MKTYIQIGANIGNDSFQRMVEKLDERSLIVLVEPNIHIIPHLEANYKRLADMHKVAMCTYGISNKKGQSNLYLYWDHQLSSLIRRYTIDEDPTDCINIETITFDDLCEFCETKEIEHLSVDTEGMDYEILLSIDLEKINIKEIIFEEWWPENDDMNGLHMTGPSLLEKVKEKYKGYNWKKVEIESMQNFKLTKI